MGTLHTLEQMLDQMKENQGRIIAVLTSLIRIERFKNTSVRDDHCGYAGPMNADLHMLINVATENLQKAQAIDAR